MRLHVIGDDATWFCVRAMRLVQFGPIQILSTMVDEMTATGVMVMKIGDTEL